MSDIGHIVNFQVNIQVRPVQMIAMKQYAFAML